MLIKVDKIQDIIKIEIESTPQLKVSLIELKKTEIFENFSEEVTINYIRGNQLFISVKNSIIRHHMYTNKNKILEKINSFFDFIIDDINIK